MTFSEWKCCTRYITILSCKHIGPNQGDLMGRIFFYFLTTYNNVDFTNSMKNVAQKIEKFDKW